MCDEQNNFCQKTKYCFALSFLQAAEMVIMGFAIFLTMMISTGTLVIVWQFKRSDRQGHFSPSPPQNRA
jgi:hypothetical protein